MDLARERGPVCEASVRGTAGVALLQRRLRRWRAGRCSIALCFLWASARRGAQAGCRFVRFAPLLRLFRAAAKAGCELRYPYTLRLYQMVVSKRWMVAARLASFSPATVRARADAAVLQQDGDAAAKPSCAEPSCVEPTSTGCRASSVASSRAALRAVRGCSGVRAGAAHCRASADCATAAAAALMRRGGGDRGVVKAGWSWEGEAVWAWEGEDELRSRLAEARARTWPAPVFVQQWVEFVAELKLFWLDEGEGSCSQATHVNPCSDRCEASSAESATSCAVSGAASSAANSAASGGVGGEHDRRWAIRFIQWDGDWPDGRPGQCSTASRTALALRIGNDALLQVEKTAKDRARTALAWLREMGPVRFARFDFLLKRIPKDAYSAYPGAHPEPLLIEITEPGAELFGVDVTHLASGCTAGCPADSRACCRAGCTAGCGTNTESRFESPSRLRPDKFAATRAAGGPR